MTDKTKDEVSFFEEIEEELKRDQMYAWLKKYKTQVWVGLGVIVFGIIAYSSWYSQKQKKMEDITSALVNVLWSDSEQKSINMIAGLLEDAPAEMKPLLQIMKSGRSLAVTHESKKEHLDALLALLALSKKTGVDIVWKDLALLVYASHRTFSTEILTMLEPLSHDSRPFHLMAKEMIAFVNLNTGKKDEAIRILKEILTYKDIPESMKKRITVLVNHLMNTIDGRQGE